MSFNSWLRTHRADRIGQQRETFIHKSEQLMTRLITRLGFLSLALAVGPLLPSDVASAANILWDGTSTSWNAPTSWSLVTSAATPNPAAKPGGADNAIFNITTVNTPQTVNLDGAQSAQGLVFNSTGTALIQSGVGGPHTLTLGTSGIMINPGAGADAITSLVSLAGPQSWTNNSSNLFTVGGNISGSHLLTITGAGNTTIGGSLGNGNGGLIKSGVGTLSLTSSNTFTGGVTINAGTLHLAHAGALNATTPNAIAFGAGSTGALRLNGNSVTISGLSTDATSGAPVVQNASATAATLTVNNNVSNNTYGGVLQNGVGGGALSLVKSGNRTLILGGASTYTGGTTVSGGTLHGDTSSLQGNINNNSSVVFDQSGSGTYSGAMSGSGSLTKSGAGTLRLSNSNTITGGVTINAGTVDLNGTGSLSVGATYVGLDSGATAAFTHSAGTHTTQTMTLGNHIGSTGTYTLSGTGSLAVSGDEVVGFDGSGVFVQTGGTHTVGGSLTFGNVAGSGTYNLSGTGSLSVAMAERINSGNTFVQSGGTHTLGAMGGLTVHGAYNLSGGNLLNLGIGTVVGGTGAGGVFTHTAGTHTLGAPGAHALFILADQPTDVGTYNLSGTGNLTVNGTADLGGVTLVAGAGEAAGGMGVLNISGGTMTVSERLRIWDTPGTALNLSGGTLSVPSLLGATTRFNWTGGTLNITDPSGLLTVGPSSFFPSLTLGMGKNLIVAGMLIEIGGALILNGGAISYTNALTLAGGAINGTAPLNNTAQINGYGTIGGSGGFTNSGGMTASAGILTLSKTGALSNSGTISLLPGGQLQLTGGSLANTGRIHFNGGTLGGAATLNNNLSGVIAGNGTMASPLSNNAGGELRAEPGKSLTLTGSGNTNSGEINLYGGLLEFTQNLTNNAGGFISGNGTLSVGNVLTNNGTMNFSGSANVVGDVTNSATGKVISSGGGPTTFFDDVANQGEIRTSAGSFTVFFGSVSGAGAFTGPGTTNFEGDLKPGNSAAAVQFAGNVVLGSDAALQIEISGITAGGQYDQIDVAGELTLGGALAISLINGFNPTVGNSFDVLDWGSLSGTFSIIDLPALPGSFAWDASQLYATGVLSITSTLLAADFDEDGDVDGADLTKWKTGFGTTAAATHMQGDANRDLDVDGADFLTWQRQLGSSASVGAATAVPEPATAVHMFLGLAAAGVLALRGRKLTVMAHGPSVLAGSLITLAAALAGMTAPVHAADRHWIDSAGGSFTDTGNWSTTDGGAGGASVPGGADKGSFARGLGVFYTTTFRGRQVLDPPLVYAIDQLTVGRNQVTFADFTNFGLLAPASVAVTNPSTTEAGRGIIIGQVSGDVARLSTTLQDFSGVAATIGHATGSTSYLDVKAGVFRVTGGSDTPLIVGNRGVGTLFISNGGLVNQTGAVAPAALGNYLHSFGYVFVTGAGSRWNSSSRLTVGNSGSGALSVYNGGQVNNANGVIGRDATSRGTAAIVGANSKWTNSGSLVVGDAGVGGLTITDGGGASSTSAGIGISLHSSGEVTVNGAGSTWHNSQSLVAGNYGAATLRLEAGGRVSNTGARIGLNSTGSGTVTVTGAASTWANSDALEVGGLGTGALTIESGGHVFNTVGEIGVNSAGSGTVSVNGTDSHWNNAVEVVVGRRGAGTLKITDGGRVTVRNGFGNLVLASEANSLADLYIGGGGGSGVVNARAVSGGAGSSAIVFNHNDAAYAFGPELTGRLAVHHIGSGFTSLTRAATYSGDTVVRAGTLLLPQGRSGGGDVTVSGGHLDVTGNLIAGSETVRLEGGAITADTISLAGGGAFHFLGGTLHADLFTGDLTNQGGVLAPGSPAGDTLIMGNYTQQSAGAMEIEIGGEGMGSLYDFVNVTGSALVGGELNLALIDGFVPTSSQTFHVLNANSILGVFDNAGNGQRVSTADGLGSFLINYGVGSSFSSNQIVLSGFQPALQFSADFDEDGDVDANDLAQWKGDFAANALSDADGDADSDGADFLTWQQQRGSSASGSVAAAVPEPSVFRMILPIALSGFAAGRIRLQRRAFRQRQVAPRSRGKSKDSRELTLSMFFRAGLSANPMLRRCNPLPTVVAVISLVLALTPAIMSHAQFGFLYSWDEPAGGAYASSANWTPSGIPDASNEAARFDVDATYDVQMPANSVTANNLQVARGTVSLKFPFPPLFSLPYKYTTNSLSVSSASGAVPSLYLVGGSAIVNGSLTVASTGQADINLQDASLTTGTATLGASVGSAAYLAVDSSSRWSGAGLQVIGAAGTGQLEVFAGWTSGGLPGAPTCCFPAWGVVTTSDAILGQQAGSRGVAVINGVWNSGNLTVGDAGTGEVNILVGSFSPPGPMIGNSLPRFFSGAVSIAAKAGSFGTVNITGLALDPSVGFIGSDWNISGSLALGGSSASGGGSGRLILGALNKASVAGDMRIWSGGRLSVTEVSNVVVDGAANLAGTLEFVPSPAFAPQVNDEYEILSAAEGVAGMFSSTLLPSLSSGLGWSIRYTPTSVRLKIVSAAPADFDEDGDVDGDDLSRWRTNFGTGATHLQGDADGDLDVDGGDFLIWQRQFGSAATTAASSAVPEPPTLLLLVSGALAMFSTVCRGVINSCVQDRCRNSTVLTRTAPVSSTHTFEGIFLPLQKPSSS
jgi:T5SS/PEP-CTERM-associated repeat protein/autotransporter-associated beta strand protein